MAEKLVRLDISLALTLRGKNARAFDRAAARRGIPPAFLLADLIEVIAADDMSDAILDDAGRCVPAPGAAPS